LLKGMKTWNKDPQSVWTVPKICFYFFWKITMGTLYIKIHLILEIIFYTFKVATTKFSWKFILGVILYV
jgi:hypothetical protein